MVASSAGESTAVSSAFIQTSGKRLLDGWLDVGYGTAAQSGQARLQQINPVSAYSMWRVCDHADFGDHPRGERWRTRVAREPRLPVRFRAHRVAGGVRGS